MSSVIGNFETFLHHGVTENTEEERGVFLIWREVPPNQKASSLSEHKTLNFGNMNINTLTGDIISAAIEVHKALGPGLLESVYEECLCHELEMRTIPYERQKELPIEYKGVKLSCGYRLDVLVSNRVILEIKSCESLERIHEAQLLTYLKLTGIKLGLLINFNVPVLKDGIKRIAN
jgi:GxxExxY protein